MPDYYSFEGSSAVFLALSYLFVLSFMSNSFSDSYIKVSTLLDEFVLFFTGKSSLNIDGALKQIIENTSNYVKSQLLCRRILLVFLAIATLIVYSIQNYYLAENGQKLIATLNSIFIFIADLMYFSLIYKQNYRLYLYTLFVDPRLMKITNCIVMILYRIAIAASVHYWILGHTVGYLCLGIVLIHSMLNIMFFVLYYSKY